jgi:serpin B
MPAVSIRVPARGEAVYHAREASTKLKVSTRLNTMNIIARTIASAAAGGALISGVAQMSFPVMAATPLNIAAEARIALLAKGYNATGQQLLAQFSTARGNIVFSPYSVGAAMSMVLAGARGDTAAEMMRALSLRMSAEAVDTGNAEVLSVLAGYDRSAAPPACPPGATLAGPNCEMRPAGDMANQCRYGLLLQGSRCVGPAQTPPSARLLAANALMLLGRGDVIAPDYITLLKTRYAAEVFQRATLGDINGWVARKTADMIPHMLERVDPDASAALLDAVYFKARWVSAFDKKLTKDEPFHVDRSQQADVAMMNQSGSFSLVSRGGYRALRLDYEVTDLGLVIVLPDDVEGAAAVARRLDANALTELFAALRDGKARKPVALALPRFKTEYKADLVEPFRQMGMRKAFEPAAADFSGMTRPGQGGVYLSTILHRAVIDVAEESTEAAAATAVVVARTVAPPAQPEPFRADHPFLFYLVDDTTGLVLFQGRISDPR